MPRARRPALSAICVAFVTAIAARDASSDTPPMALRVAPGATSLVRAEPPAAAERPIELRPVAWASALAPVLIKNPNAQIEGRVKLYAADGSIDPDALAEFRRLAGDGEHHAPLEPRVVQLVFRAAYHFDAHAIVLISSYRPGRRNGYHGKGAAIDFQLPGVGARKLASYLRHTPRAGVGVYTNPRTQFVHVDARQTSWHWIDASPPGRHWKEKPLPDKSREERDAEYTEASDLPEVAAAVALAARE